MSCIIGMALIVSATSTTAESSQHSISLWQLVVGAGGVVGLIAGLYTLVDAVQRRKYRPMEDQTIALMAKAQDVETVKQDYDKYSVLRESLRLQVEKEVPQEARRVYLRSRLDTLQASIGAEVDEYQRLRDELTRVEGQEPSPLDARLRPVIEESIRPGYVRRRRNERLVVGILVLLLLTTISPLAPRGFVGGIWQSYSHSIKNPAYAPAADLNSSLLTGGVAVALAILALVRWRIARGRFVAPRQIRIGAIVAAAGLAATIGGLLLGFTARSDSLAEQAGSEKATELHQTVGERDGFEGPRARRLEDDIDQRDKAAARGDARASVALWTSHLGAGVCIGILLTSLLLHRRGRGSAPRSPRNDPQDAAVARLKPDNQAELAPDEL